MPFANRDWFPEYKKIPYRAVFSFGQTQPWDQDEFLVEGYYKRAYDIVEGIVAGRLRAPIDGIPGIFLFRHYLELASKYIIFYSCRLDDFETVSTEDIVPAGKIHALGKLWSRAKQECEKRMPEEIWRRLDVAAVDGCVVEFDKWDCDGVLFRYAGQRFGANEHPREVPAIAFAALLANMDHIHNVLHPMIFYPDEVYAQLRDVAQGWSTD